jgi:hypothetical protein
MKDLYRRAKLIGTCARHLMPSDDEIAMGHGLGRLAPRSAWRHLGIPVAALR